MLGRSPNGNRCFRAANHAIQVRKSRQTRQAPARLPVRLPTVHCLTDYADRLRAGSYPHGQPRLFFSGPKAFSYHLAFLFTETLRKTHSDVTPFDLLGVLRAPSLCARLPASARICFMKKEHPSINGIPQTHSQPRRLITYLGPVARGPVGKANLSTGKAA